MSTPILATKLYIPPPRPKVVLRPRLIERLNEGLHHKLTLISAPAGFGKTTLVSGWVAEGVRPTAWVSLDENDNDPIRFVTYLVAALQKIAAVIGEGTLDMLMSPQPPPLEAILTALLNEIAAVREDFVLVLDDYHMIDTRPVDDALAFLLKHLPPQMHLVMTTREDPLLPLSRLRARGQLTELRVADLRFTPDEAATFLNQVMGLNLSAGDVAALEARTEGWITGLQLAAISMQGHTDATRFIESFTGSHYFVMDYLVEEVLHQQPEEVQAFLLDTSILDRLCGPLCDVVLGAAAASGQETLEYLERANLLLVPLDDHRQWYRYHHLFGDVLYARLMKEAPQRAAGLHRRASEWYAANDLRDESIHHALESQDFEWAAGLIERAWPAMDGNFESARWLNWARSLPEESIRARPVLAVGCAWSLLDTGQLEAAEAQLRAAEHLLGLEIDTDERPKTLPDDLVVMDEKLFWSLPASIATARAYLAQALGDVPGSMIHARRALQLAPEDDKLRRGQASALLGVAYWTEGDLEAANQVFGEYMTRMLTEGTMSDAVSTTYVVANIKAELGHLREALHTCEQALWYAKNQVEATPVGLGDLYREMSEIYHELGDLEAAEGHLLTAEELSEQNALTNWRYRLHTAQALLKVSRGDLACALDLLEEAERQYVRNPVPDVRPLAAHKARIWAAQGRLNQALGWARERGLSISDDLCYLAEFEHITLARVLMAHYRQTQEYDSVCDALVLLDRLLKAAEAGGRLGNVIEILILQAMALEVQGKMPAALLPLRRALTLAEPERYVRLFVDEGQPVAHLLTQVSMPGMMSDYVDRLLRGFAGVSHRPETDSAPRPKTTAMWQMVEPLSERELEVLKLIAQGLSNQEISERLFLALSTVKGHNRNIFDKLQVQRRTEAVARAREMGLF